MSESFVASKKRKKGQFAAAFGWRKFWDLGDLCDDLSTDFSHVEVPSTGVQVSTTVFVFYVSVFEIALRPDVLGDEGRK